MHGIALPRDSDLQARAGTGVALAPDLAELRPGDLLFFAEGDARVSHVAISLGGPLIIAAAQTSWKLRTRNSSPKPSSRFSSSRSTAS